MLHQLSKHVLAGLLVLLLFLMVPAYAVENVKVSDYGAGVQLWFEVEDFDERDPADDSSFALSDEPGAFGRSISSVNSNDGASMIRYTFDISKAGGAGGTWYFWGRVINPNNNSDFMLVEGDPGDASFFPIVVPVSGLTNDKRIFEQSGLGNDWVWAPTAGSAGEESHTKQLRDGENTMYVLNRESGAIWDVFMWTNDPDYVPTDADYENATRYVGGVASKPNPTDGAIDVPREVVLSWKPGEYAPAMNGHRIFLSTAFSDVNDGTTGVAQDASSYAPPQRLEFDTTYYWRVDEVNGPPDSTVYKGSVWSFTTEPVAYPVDGANIMATASSTAGPEFGPENTVNGSGLDANGLHSVEPTGMWLSGDEPTGAWIQYELDKLYKLHQMLVWNGNQAFEGLFGFGFKDVMVEYSTNGVDWTVLADALEFGRGPAASGYAANTTIDFAGAAAKYVKLTATSNWGAILPQYNLSEVRFFSIPVVAREPSPADGAADVDPAVTLSWRAGREAGTHDVYLSDDYNAVVDGTAVVESLTDARHGPLDLDLAKIYFWRVDEANDVETPALWQGNVWSFSTSESLAVEDFESYNDIDPPDPESDRIFESWIDGFGVATNGALVGNDLPPYLERTIVHGGSQSVPVFYSNTAGAVSSEITRTFAPGQDWSKHSIRTLGLYFFGTEGNTGQLYVKINNTKIPYDGQATNIARAGWQPWNIDLTTAGVNLQSVTTLAIGIDGNGAAGTLYLDDIRLSPYERQIITPVVPDDAGLIGHWAFDGNLQDASGLGNHGTGGGDPTFVAGQTGQALDLDGSDYVVIDGVADDITTTTFTVSAWIKTTQTDDGNVVASNDAAGSNHEFIIGVDQGLVLVEADSINRYPPTVNDNQWHFIAYVRDGGTAYIYVDGFQVGTETPSGDPVGQGRWSIGQEWDSADASSPSDFYTGQVDEVRIHNYALSHAEIAGVSGRTEPFDGPLSAPLVEVQLEAEAADTLGASWRSYDDPAASGGKAIGSDDGDGNDNDVAPGADWTATYSFTVPAGEYKILLHAQENGSDSFWVRIPTAVSQTHEDPDQPGTGWVRFNGIDAPSGWAWDEVHSDDHDQAVVTWLLPAGDHTVEIAKREDGVLLDAIVITNVD